MALYAEDNYSVQALIKDFSGNTSIGGISQIKNSKELFLQIFWIVCAIICWSALFYYSFQLGKVYAAYPVRTELKLVTRSNLKFPTVTFCNNNPLRVSTISSNAKLRGLAQLDEAISRIFKREVNEDFGYEIKESHCDGYTCPNERFCIPSSWVCDGEDDCDDKSDETNCKDEESHAMQKDCLSGYIQCPDGLCIRQKQICNGESDCNDGFDESDIFSCDVGRKNFTDCGKTHYNLTLNEEILRLHSLNFPENYPNLATCNYYISAPNKSSSYIVKFMEFNLEESQDCTADSLQLMHIEKFDDKTEKRHYLSSRLCGKNIPRPIQVLHGDFIIAFQADITVAKKGFFLEIHHIAPSENKELEVKLESEFGTIGGRITVYHNDKFLYVSSKDFTRQAANHICGNLSWIGVDEIIFEKPNLTVEHCVIYKAEVNNGTNQTVVSATVVHQCSLLVRLRCLSAIADGSLRLVGGHNNATSISGRLEIYKYGIWGIICDDSWNSVATNVACASGGFGSGLRYFCCNKFGWLPSNSTIWLDNVNCLESSKTLESCYHNGIGIHNCNNNEAVGIECLKKLDNENESFTPEEMCKETIFIDTDKLISFISPNYPENYPFNIRCEYVIHSNNSSPLSSIVIRFEDFVMEELCIFDRLEIFVMNGSEPNLLKTYCGVSLPKPLIIDEKSITIKFTTDGNKSFRGFNITLYVKARSTEAKNFLLNKFVLGSSLINDGNTETCAEISSSIVINLSKFVQVSNINISGSFSGSLDIRGSLARSISDITQHKLCANIDFCSETCELSCNDEMFLHFLYLIPLNKEKIMICEIELYGKESFPYKHSVGYDGGYQLETGNEFILTSPFYNDNEDPHLNATFMTVLENRDPQSTYVMQLINAQFDGSNGKFEFEDSGKSTHLLRIATSTDLHLTDSSDFYKKHVLTFSQEEINFLFQSTANRGVSSKFAAHFKKITKVDCHTRNSSCVTQYNIDDDVYMCFDNEICIIQPASGFSNCNLIPCNKSEGFIIFENSSGTLNENFIRKKRASINFQIASPFKYVKPFDWKQALKHSVQDDYEDFRMLALFQQYLVKSNGHQLNDTIVQCSFDQQECIHEDFTQIQSPVYGNCFTFSGNRSTYRTGTQYGLKVTFFVDSNEYLSVLAPSYGGRVSILHQGDAWLPTHDSFGFAAGHVTYVSLRQSIIQRMGPPWTECTDKWPEGFNVKLDYNRELCLYICVQKEMNERCHCVDDYISFLGDNVTVCDMWNAEIYACRQQIYLDFANKKLNCSAYPMQCTQRYYDRDISIAEWPSPPYSMYLLRKLRKGGKWKSLKLMNAIAEMINGSSNDADKLFERVRKNFASIHIYFKELNYQATKEAEAFSFSDLVAAFGGNLGLFLGMSLLSVFEVFELFIRLLYIIKYAVKPFKALKVHSDVS